MSVDSLELRRKEAREQLLGTAEKFGVDSLGLIKGMHLTRLASGGIFTNSAFIVKELIRQGVFNKDRPDVGEMATRLAGDLAETYTLERQRWDGLFSMPSVKRIIDTEFNIQIP